MIQRERVKVLLDTVPGVIGDGVAERFGLTPRWIKTYAEEAGVPLDRVPGLGYRKKTVGALDT